MNDNRRPTAPTIDAVADAAGQLQRALARVGDALITLDTDALLALEGELQSAIELARHVTGAGDRTAGADAIERAAKALARCRRLGTSFSEIARGLARVAGATGGYDRAGTYIDRSARSSWLVRA